MNILNKEKTAETGNLNRSNDDDIAILVPSFDGYQDLWKSFFSCFFKYWPDCPYPIFLGSNFQTYDDPLVSPIRIGEDKDYSSNLIAMLSHMEHEWVIVMLDDVLLSAPVHTSKVKRIIAVAQDKGAGHVQLLASRYNPTIAIAFPLISDEVAVIPIGLPYRASLNLGLWKKSVLLKLLQPGETAWDFERQGSLRTFKLKDKFFCLSKKQISDPPFRFIHGVVKREWTWEANQFMQKEECYGFLNNRRIQSFSSYLKLKFYIFLRYFIYIVIHKLFGKEVILRIVSKK